MRNLQAQTFFFQLQAHKQFFFFQATVLQKIFFYEMQCFIMRSFMLLRYCYHILNNIGGPVFMLPYLSAAVPEFFCCLYISAFNLSSTCLLVSLITSSLQSTQYFKSLSIVLLRSTGVTLALPSSQATLSRESSGFPQHSSSLLSRVLGQKSLVFLASLSTFAFFNENFSQKSPFAIRSDENVVKFARLIVTVVRYRCIHSFPSGLRTLEF